MKGWPMNTRTLLAVGLVAALVLGVAVIDRGGGRGARGAQRGQEVPQHNHPELMSRQAHDQELHEQHTLPLKTKSGEAGDTGTSGSGGTHNTIVSDTFDVPSWAKKVTVIANANAGVAGATTDDVITSRTTVDGTVGRTVSGHFHSAYPDAGSVSPTQTHEITSPGSTITVSVGVSANGETVTATVSWTAFFERFE